MRFKTIIPWAIFVFVLGTYALTVPNTNPNLADSDELLTAIKVLGVAHPPGYPLYIMLSALFATLPLPLNFVGKVNLLSAIFSSLTILLFYLSSNLFLKKFLKDQKVIFLASILASLTLAFSYHFWFYGIFAEVFPLNNLLTILIIYLLLLWDQKPSAKNKNRSNKLLLLISFILGLNLSNQQVTLLLIPAITVWILFKNWQIIKNWKLILLSLSILLLGFFLPYLYVPIASSHQPFINWENVDSPYKLYRLITRRAYADVSPSHSSYLYFSQINLNGLSDQIGSFLGYLIQNLNPWYFLIASAGLILLLKKSGLLWLKFKKINPEFLKIFLFIILGLIGSGLFFAIYDPLHLDWRGSDDFSLVTFIQHRFYLVSLIFASFLLALGLSVLLTFLARQNKKVFLLAVAVLFFITLSTLTDNFISLKQNDFSIANQYGKEYLNLVEKDGLVFCFTAEEGCFLSYYLQNVENIRPDITIIPGDFNQRSKEQLLAKIPDLMKTTSISQVNRFRDILRWQIDKRPIYVIGLNSRDEWLSILNVDGNPFYFTPVGCGLFKITKTFDPNLKPSQNCNYLEEAILSTPENDQNYYRQIYAALFAYHHYMSALVLKNHSCFNLESDQLKIAITLLPNYILAKNELVKLQQATKPDNCPTNAGQLTIDDVIKKSQERYSAYQKSQQKNDLDLSISYAFEATMLDPNSIPLRLKLADLVTEAQYYQAAAGEYQDILILDPNNQTAQNKLNQLGQ